MTKREFFKRYLNISEKKILNELEYSSEVWTVKKKEIIMEEGEVVTDIPFLMSGILKAYYHDPRGREKVYCFAHCPGDPAASVNDIYEMVEAMYTVEAIQMSELCYISLPVIQKLIQEEPEVRQIYETLLSASIINMTEHEKVISTYSPVERYEWFQERYQNVELSISQKDIASYLNMSPEHLSRIRKNRKLDQK